MNNILFLFLVFYFLGQCVLTNGQNVQVDDGTADPAPIYHESILNRISFNESSPNNNQASYNFNVKDWSCTSGMLIRRSATPTGGTFFYPAVGCTANYPDPDQAMGNNDYLFRLTSHDNQSGLEKTRFNIDIYGRTTIGDDLIAWNYCGSEFKLYVDGGIRSKRVKVDEVTNWCDYVFEEGYTLMPLGKLEKYIQANRHLPDVPSEKEVKEEGIDVADMDALLLKKIEELTLYVIQLKKENNELRKQQATEKDGTETGQEKTGTENESLQKRLDELEKKVKELGKLIQTQEEDE